MSNDLVYKLVADSVAVMVITRVQKKDANPFSMEFLLDAGLFVGAASLNEMFLRAWMAQYVYNSLPVEYQNAAMVVGDLITISGVKMILNRYLLGKTQAMSLKELIYEVMVNFSTMATAAQVGKLMVQPAPTIMTTTTQ